VQENDGQHGAKKAALMPLPKTRPCCDMTSAKAEETNAQKTNHRSWLRLSMIRSTDSAVSW